MMGGTSLKKGAPRFCAFLRGVGGNVVINIINGVGI